MRLAFEYGQDDRNNGNIAQQTIRDGILNGSMFQAVRYNAHDRVNRLTSATEGAPISGSTCSTGATWGRDFDYDNFGSRWINQSLDTLHQATPTASSNIEMTTNRLAAATGAVYDAAGNMTQYPWITGAGGAMTYDANNKMTASTASGVDVVTGYDAGDRRVRKVYNGQTTVWVYDSFVKIGKSGQPRIAKAISLKHCSHMS